MESRQRLGRTEEAEAQVKLGRGTIVAVELDPTVGHEQRGLRPCVVVSDPEIIRDQRFPLICIVPVTGTPGHGLLYPPLSPGRSGLAKPSFALIDHLRSVDKRRIVRVFSQLPDDEIEAVNVGLTIFLGLGEGPDAPGSSKIQ